MPSYTEVPISEAPNSEPASSKKRELNVQGHVAFFDRDGDGIIWPRDTYKGFRSLGFGVPLSLMAGLAINGAFSRRTSKTGFDPYFRLYVEGMANAKHGSDSDAYDPKGKFDEKRFEDIFATYADPPHDGLTYPQVLRMVRGNADRWDVSGVFAGLLEWSVAYLMLWPADGKMKKDDLKGIYDGSIFWTVEERNAKKTT